MPVVNITVEWEEGPTPRSATPCDAHRGANGEGGPSADKLVYLGKMRYAIALCGRCYSEAFQRSAPGEIARLDATTRPL